MRACEVALRTERYEFSWRSFVRMRVVGRDAVSTLSRSRKAFISFVLADVKCESKSSTMVIFGRADMSAVEMARRFSFLFI